MLPSGWYWCDGSNKNRVTDAPLFNAITIQQSGVTTAGSPVITGLSDTANGGNAPISPGMPVSGTGIPANTVVQSVDSGTQVTLSANATASATVPLVFAPYGVGDGSTSFGLPNRARIAVGRDNASGSASNIMQVSTTITTTSGSPTATVASATGLYAGMFISHPKVPNGTKIAAIVNTTITMSANATGTVAASAARFSPLLDAQTVGATGGALFPLQSLVTANLPPYTPSGSLSLNVGSLAGTYTGGTPVVQGSGGGIGGGGSFGVSGGLTVSISGAPGGSFTGSAQGGTSAPFAVSSVQPTIIMNYIIKR